MSDTQVSFGEFWDGVLASEAVRTLPNHATLSPRAVSLAETLLDTESGNVTVAPPALNEAPTWTEAPASSEARPTVSSRGTDSQGDIEILTQIGEGGMGVVHRAHQ